MLIVILSYSQNGTDSCKIVTIKQDTFGLVPIQFISNSNRVKNMNDAHKLLLDSCQKESFQLTKIVSVQKQENIALEGVILNQNKDIDKLIGINNKQAETIKKQSKTITLLKYIVATETVILVLLAIFK